MIVLLICRDCCELFAKYVRKESSQLIADVSGLCQKVKLLVMLLGTNIHKLLWKECCKLIREMLPRQCTGAFEGDPVNLSVTVLGDPR